MTTVTTSSPASFEIGPFQTVAVIGPASASGQIAFTSLAGKLRSDVDAALKTQTYGPYGVPMSVAISSTSGSWEYTVGTVDPHDVRFVDDDALTVALPDGSTGYVPRWSDSTGAALVRPVLSI